MTESVSATDPAIESSAPEAEPAPRFERQDDPAEKAMSVTALVRKLIDDAGRLFRKELAMATSEVVESVEQTKSGIVGVVGGAAVLYGGVLFLLGAAAIGLAGYMPEWAAVLAVGVAATLIGFIMLHAGKRKMKLRRYAPERTAEALRRDRDMLRRQVQ